MVSAATAPGYWLHERDKYYQHVFSCELCNARYDRLCDKGKGLRFIYNAATEKWLNTGERRNVARNKQGNFNRQFGRRS